jgi:tetratricopeptide (TPR) repeat protein
LQRQRSEEVISLAERQGMPIYLGMGKAFLGWSLTDQDPGEAVAALTEGIELLARTGNLLPSLALRTYLGEALGAAGRQAEAIRNLDDMLVVSERRGILRDHAELHRVRAKVLLESKPGSEPEAEALLRRALEIARAQEARSYELRAAMNLARLWQRLDRTAEAHALLAPIYAWFTEGFDTRDLIDAKALLEDLVR